MSKKHNPYNQGVLSGAVSPKKDETVDAFEERPAERIRGPQKGDFVAPPEVVDTDERTDALPEQEDFWRPPVRFGSIPVEKEPLGWDRRRGYRKLFPLVSLPTQVVERVSFGHPSLEPNRLFWGDNLHVMRQLPSESIDLIYIDPPFFSGRQYNVIFGDQNELRSFSDIWEGGMPGYLIWLNARIYEMKRLLKKTGSIYIHLDWHASHYLKIEMDKIFGYDHMVNEIIWSYKSGGNSKKTFARKHDVLLVYSKTDRYIFNTQYYKSWQKKKYNYNPNYPEHYDEKEKMWYHLAICRDVWDDVYVIGTDNKERIGYPTQKPESLLERVINASSNEGGVVADFFCGGGTMAAVAQRNKRQWIVCDQSRVAVALTADRVSKLVDQEVGSLFSVPDVTIEHWGIYEAERLSKMPIDQFRSFIVRAFGAVPDFASTYIHGYKGAIPIWVGEPSQRTSISAKDVEDLGLIRLTIHS